MLRNAIITGSISSSCCFIQLCLNLLSSIYTLPIGCAGFNTTLGPWRPYTRTLTVAWLIRSWVLTFQHKKINERGDDQSIDSNNNGCCNGVHGATSKKSTIMKSKVISTIICLILMFMPEGLQFFGGPAIAPSVESKNLLRLNYTVDNMGCEACVYSVEALISRQPGIVSAKPNLSEGRLKS